MGPDGGAAVVDAYSMVSHSGGVTPTSPFSPVFTLPPGGMAAGGGRHQQPDVIEQLCRQASRQLQTTDICDLIVGVCNKMHTMAMDESIDSICDKLESTAISTRLYALSHQVSEVCVAVKLLSLEELQDLVQQLSREVSKVRLDQPPGGDPDTIHHLLSSLTLHQLPDEPQEVTECTQRMMGLELSNGTPQEPAEYESVCRMIQYLLTSEKPEPQVILHHLQQLHLL